MASSNKRDASLSLNFYIWKWFARSRPWVRRESLVLERLENRLALSTDAPFVVAMTPHDDGQVLLEMSEGVVNLDIGDFALNQGALSIDLSDATIEATSASLYSLHLPELGEGLFQLRLLANDSAIADLEGHLLQQDASTQLSIQRPSPSWQVEYSQTTASHSVQRIAALGDSMTFEGGGSYTASLRDLLSSKTVEVRSFAAAGWKAEKLMSVWQSEVSGQGFDTLIVFSGIPDLSSVGATAQSTFGKLRNIYEDASAHGLNVICIGLSPWAQYKKWTPERQAETIQLNALIRQYVADHPNNMRYVDAYAGLGSPDEPQRLWPRYDVGDGLHLVPVGDERLARLVSTAVLSFESTTPISQSAVIAFNRPVFGLTPEHIQLSDSSSAIFNQLVPIDSSHYRIDFSVPPETVSQLRLNLDLNQEPIVDENHLPVGRQPDVFLSIDYQSPSVTLHPELPTVSPVAAEHIQIVFSEQVTDVTLRNFMLLRDRVLLAPLQGAVTRLDASTFDLQIDPSLTTRSGNYQLVYAPSLDIQDPAGNLSRRGRSLSWVKLDTAPYVSDGILYLTATSGLDNLEVIVGQSTIQYTINGIEQSFSRDGIQRIEVQPGLERDLVSLAVAAGAVPLPVIAVSNDGLDRAYLYDSIGDDLFTSSPSVSSLTYWTVELAAVGFAQVTAISRNGSDRATLIDSPSSDKLEAASRLTALRGPDREVTAMNFASVLAISQNGGSDTAELSDTAGDDSIVGTMELVTLNVPGYQISVQDYARVNVRATQGIDRVTLTGSTADERFVGQMGSSAWTSGSRSRYFYNVDQIDVSSGGGNDQVTLYDSPGNDTLNADSRTATLITPMSQLTVRNFPRTNIYARSGIDTVNFEGSSLSESFVGQATFSSLTAGSYSVYAYGFDKSQAIGGGGNDTAKLFGSAGVDTFEARSQTARLFGTNYEHTVTNYKSVNAYASAGNDSAYLVGTAALETVSGKPAVTKMTGSLFTNVANNFVNVTVDSGGGADIATLNDSSGDERFVGTPSQSTLQGAAHTITAQNYVRVNAYASAGNDRAELTGSSGNDIYTGRPTDSSLKGTSYLVFASGFDSVVANGAGGNDTANFYDSAGDDQASVGPSQSSMIGLNYNNAVTDFDRVQMYASSGNDIAYYTDSLGNDKLSGSGSSATITSSGLVIALQRFKGIHLSNGQGGTNQILLNAITYQLYVGVGWLS